VTNVIGIDPSLTATGFCQQGRTWAVRATAGDERLVGLWAATTITAERCDLAVLEDLPVHGMGAGKTGMAQGVIRLALMQLGVPYATMAPGTLKKFATGRGNATKADMRIELYKRAGLDLADDNQVDAWWLCQAGLLHLGAGEIALPKLHTDALAKVKWQVFTPPTERQVP
jgi:Holliday junction resolvasome RuvABC endonuclease subunit